MIHTLESCLIEYLFIKKSNQVDKGIIKQKKFLKRYDVKSNSKPPSKEKTDY